MLNNKYLIINILFNASALTYRRCLYKYRRYLYIFRLKIKKHRRCVKKTKAGKEVSTVVLLPFPAFVFGFHAVISRYPR